MYMGLYILHVAFEVSMAWYKKTNFATTQEYKLVQPSYSHAFQSQVKLTEGIEWQTLWYQATTHDHILESNNLKYDLQIIVYKSLKSL